VLWGTPNKCVKNLERAGLLTLFLLSSRLAPDIHSQTWSR
jgi:hypothetical protein